MAKDVYRLETIAHKVGYNARDVKGKTGRDIDEEKDAKREGWESWAETPACLETGVDVTDVWRRVEAEVAPIDVRTSNEAGRYACEYIYYTSMAHFWRQANPEPNSNPPLDPPALAAYAPGSSLTSEPFRSYPPPALQAPPQQETLTERLAKHVDTTPASQASRHMKDARIIKSKAPVLFLHVPEGLEETDLQRGGIVLKSVIRAMIVSWEKGIERERANSLGSLRTARETDDVFETPMDSYDIRR
jgi:hypothetical protein